MKITIVVVRRTGAWEIWLVPPGAQKVKSRAAAVIYDASRLLVTPHVAVDLLDGSPRGSARQYEVAVDQHR